MQARAADRRSMWLVTGLLILVQIAFLYVVLPGRAPSTFTAVQPDSVQYLCYGLHLGPLSDTEVAATATTVLSHYGYADVDCLEPRLSTNLIWLVYPRLLLPLLVAVASLLPAAFAILVPSVLFYAAFWIVWMRCMVPRSREPRLRDWLLAVGPLLAINMVIWPAAVLTEGPLLVWTLLSVLLISHSTPLRGSVTLISAAALGVLMLLTRQTWPMVGILLACALVQSGAMVRLVPLTSRAGQFLRAGLAATLGGALAFLAARAIELATVPDQVAAQQGSSSQLIPSSVSSALSIAWAAVTSTVGDVATSVLRGDLISPLTLVAGLIALVLLARARKWLPLAFVASAWLLGLYSVGLVASQFGAYGTHFRYLVPAVFASIATARPTLTERAGA